MAKKVKNENEEIKHQKLSEVFNENEYQENPNSLNANFDEFGNPIGINDNFDEFGNPIDSGGLEVGTSEEIEQAEQSKKTKEGAKDNQNLTPPSSIERNEVVVPKGELKNMRFGHLGKNFSNLAIVCLILSMASLFTFLMSGVVMLLGCAVLIIMFMIMLVSIGTIFAIDPDYWNKLTTVAENLGKSSGIMEDINKFLFSLWPIVSPIAIGLSAMAIVCLALDRSSKHTVRIVCSSFICVLAIVVTIMLAVGGVN